MSLAAFPAAYQAHLQHLNRLAFRLQLLLVRHPAFLAAYLRPFQRHRLQTPLALLLAMCQARFQLLNHLVCQPRCRVTRRLVFPAACLRCCRRRRLRQLRVVFQAHYQCLNHQAFRLRLLLGCLL